MSRSVETVGSVRSPKYSAEITGSELASEWRRVVGDAMEAEGKMFVEEVQSVPQPRSIADSYYVRKTATSGSIVLSIGNTHPAWKFRERDTRGGNRLPPPRA